MATVEGPDAWSRFLRSMTSQPGWSVARLARESGIARGTIFDWIRFGGRSLNVASVRAIAAALDVDMALAMFAAGNIIGSPDISDPELRVILGSRLSDPQKARMIAHVRERRARELEATQAMIDLVGGPDVG
jgi:transcriptional regulator with XRE-family HTH domain